MNETTKNLLIVLLAVAFSVYLGYVGLSLVEVVIAGAISGAAIFVAGL